MIGIFEDYESKVKPSADEFLTLQQVKKDLVGEIDAVLQYDQHIHESNNKLAIQTWKHIRDEELVHIGELLSLWQHLNPKQFAFIKEGINEFEEHKNEWQN